MVGWRLCVKVAVCLIFIVPSHHALDNGLVPTPPMGWLTWERFRCTTDCEKYPDQCIGERLLREMAEAMVSEGYADVGYEYIIVDDCWMARERDDDGRLVADPIRFPNGIKNLTQYMHSLGLKFGIYEDLGTSTCAGYPGSLEYMEIDADQFAEWEVDYVKFDGCNSDPADFDVNYPAFGKYLNATGRPIVYSCEWPVYQIANMEVDYEHIKRTCNVWRNYYDIDDSYSSVSNVINWHGDNQDKFADLAGPGSWNDPDMIVIGNFGLSYEQSKAQMAIWSIMASPLIMSNDLRAIDPQMKEILQNKKIIAVNQDALGKQGKRVYNNDGIQVWVKPVEPVVNDITSYAVAVISTRSDGFGYGLSVNVSDLGINSGETYTVTDLFGKLPNQDLTPRDNLEVLVPPSGAQFLKFEVQANGKQ